MRYWKFRFTISRVGGLRAKKSTGATASPPSGRWLSIGLSNKDITMIIMQLLSALEHLHKNGIIHLDVKPENIRYCKINHQILLYDFGLF